MVVGSVAVLNGPGHMGGEDWYPAALEYWDGGGVAATVDGMLGGFADLSPADLAASGNFLREVAGLPRRGGEGGGAAPGGGRGRALECGAGIGRVTRGLLLPLGYGRVDLVEVSPRLLAAAPDHVGDPGAGRCRFLCRGLQDYDPPPEIQYDLVWVQWCVGYLTDVDCVRFLRRMRRALAPGGVVVLKDNACGCGDEFVLDREDSSVTRSERYLIALATLAGLEVVRRRNQGDIEGEEAFPEDIFSVPMIALGRMEDDGGEQEQEQEQEQDGPI